MLKDKPCKIIGHRGAAGLKFENTLESIKAAIECHVDFIEIDVWITIDNEIIVFHDTFLDKLTSSNGLVASKNLKELRDIILPNGEKIPLLIEVISLIKNYDIPLLVEIKSEKAFEKTLEILRENLSDSNFIIGSFYHQKIMEYKKMFPELQTSIMFECVPAYIDEYLVQVNPDFITIAIETFNDTLINAVREQNRKLIFYTINTLNDYELALQTDPFGIVTNYPNKFI